MIPHTPTPTLFPYTTLFRSDSRQTTLRIPELNSKYPSSASSTFTIMPRAKTSSTRMKPWHRSEEHTSELQSRPHLVCRLLLEKKKNIYSNISFISVIEYYSI